MGGHLITSRSRAVGMDCLVLACGARAVAAFVSIARTSDASSPGEHGEALLFVSQLDTLAERARSSGDPRRRLISGALALVLALGSVAAAAVSWWSGRALRRARLDELEARRALARQNVELQEAGDRLELARGCRGAPCPIRGGRPRQSGLPCDDVARDTHSPPRRDRHDRTAARHSLGRRTARLRRNGAALRSGPPRDRQRHPRLLEDRGRPARARRDAIRARHAGLRSHRAGGCARGAAGHRAARAPRPGMPGRVHRRPRPDSPGAAQPALERCQIHARRLRARGDRARFPRRRVGTHPLLRRGHGHRHRRSAHPRALRGVLTGRRLHDAQVRRDRPRP